MGFTVKILSGVLTGYHVDTLRSLLEAASKNIRGWAGKGTFTSMEMGFMADSLGAINSRLHGSAEFVVG